MPKIGKLFLNADPLSEYSIAIPIAMTMATAPKPPAHIALVLTTKFQAHLEPARIAPKSLAPAVATLSQADFVAPAIVVIN
jgi:hypothetical protein